MDPCHGHVGAQDQLMAFWERSEDCRIVSEVDLPGKGT